MASKPKYHDIVPTLKGKPLHPSDEDSLQKASKTGSDEGNVNSSVGRKAGCSSRGEDGKSSENKGEKGKTGLDPMLCKPENVPPPYQDYSQAPCADTSKTAAKTTASSRPRGVGTKDPHTYPVKLHQILADPRWSDVIAWLPHGRSWRILQQKRFEKEVIPLYFGHGRYSSFARQVSGWGFRRITYGSDYNSYYHEVRTSAIIVMIRLRVPVPVHQRLLTLSFPPFCVLFLTALHPQFATFMWTHEALDAQGYLQAQGGRRNSRS